MEQRKIVLLRMPPWQDSESKAFIGTLVISQLLKAIFLRAEVSEHLRTPFAIYCDEFQMFATPDFAKLFTQTGKYRVMPAVAHQDRVGQFKPNDPNRGATMVALLKVIFTLPFPTVKRLRRSSPKIPPRKQNASGFLSSPKTRLKTFCGAMPIPPSEALSESICAV
jgi:hypothetical protein